MSIAFRVHLEIILEIVFENPNLSLCFSKNSVGKRKIQNYAAMQI